ncbi:guanine nucleotide-binding protein subunit gamma 2-like [Musa acuminata AAA Group]
METESERMATNGEDAEPEARPQPSHPRPLRRTGDFLGKHRLSAAISRLNQEIQYLQAELDEIETMKPSSEACKAVVLSTEGKSDALLPVTPGPENPAWHRWFQRVPSSHSRKWWTHKGSDVS